MRTISNVSALFLSALWTLVAGMHSTPANAAEQKLKIMLTYDGAEFSGGLSWKLSIRPYAQRAIVESLAVGESTRDVQAHNRIRIQFHCSSEKKLYAVLRPFKKRSDTVSVSYQVTGVHLMYQAVLQCFEPEL